MDIVWKLICQRIDKQETNSAGAKPQICPLQQWSLWLHSPGGAEAGLTGMIEASGYSSGEIILAFLGAD